MCVQFTCGPAFRAEMAAGDRRLGIALNRKQLAIFVINQLSAADAAIWTNRRRDLRAIDFRAQAPGALRHRFDPGAVRTRFDLLNEGPAGKQFLEHTCLQGKMPATLRRTSIIKCCRSSKSHSPRRHGGTEKIARAAE